jgi:hypothetical protein
MVNKSEIEVLLVSKSLKQIESAITDRIGCDLYKDNFTLLTGFIKEEVDASMLPLNVIETFIENNPEVIVNFSGKFLENSKPLSLSTGIAITYSVYLIYLKEKDKNDLLEYLKRRRIPKPNMLLEQLLSIKKEMNL